MLENLNFDLTVSQISDELNAKLNPSLMFSDN